MKKIILSALTLSACSTLSNAALIAHWKLDNNANDSSITGANGVAGGNITYTTGADGSANGAASFSGAAGAADSIIINSADLETVNDYQSFTMSYWVNADTGAFGIPVSARAGNDGYEFQAGITNQTWLHAATPNPWEITRTGALTNDGTTWTHVAGTFDADSNTLRIYVNGSLNDTLVTAGDLDAIVSTIRIGGGNNGGTGFDGSVDDVQLYDEALDLTQIQYLANVNNIGTAAPEPSSTALLGLGGLALILRRKK